MGNSMISKTNKRCSTDCLYTSKLFASSTFKDNNMNSEFWNLLIDANQMVPNSSFKSVLHWIVQVAEIKT